MHACTRRDRTAKVGVRPDDDKVEDDGEGDQNANGQPVPPSRGGKAPLQERLVSQSSPRTQLLRTQA